MDGFSLKASLGAELPGSDGEVDGLGLGAKVSDGGIHIGFFEVYTKTPLTYSISTNLQHTSLPVQIGSFDSPASAHMYFWKLFQVLDTTLGCLCMHISSISTVGNTAVLRTIIIVLVINTTIVIVW